MANANPKPPGKPAARKAVAAPPPPSAIPQPWYWIGAAALAVSAAASGVLVLKHFGAADLPGCGPGAGCDEAARSFWGRIPGWGLPVSCLGFAYFAALLVGWLCSRGTAAWSLRGLLWLGAFCSLMYIGIMLTQGWTCVYCLTAHLANFVVVFATERHFWPQRLNTRAVGITAVTFVVLLAGLGSADFERQRRIRAADEASLQQSLRDITQRSQAAGGSSPQSATSSVASPASSPASASVDSTPAVSPPSSRPQAPFTGRYRYGPEKAPIRIVMFTDYQCPDCRLREREVAEIMRTRQDVSISSKHYPFCKACNPNVPDLHKNACWAARAAEAAGLLGGSDAFWKMHAWLFEKQGKFESNQQLAEGAAAAGVDAGELARLMQGPRTLEIVRADIDEAMSLGIERTPMIFVNGVELKGWRAPRALLRMVEEVSQSNPPTAGPEDDQPPRALERFLTAWRETEPRPIPARAGPFGFGTPGSKPEIILWGDYQEPETAMVDQQVREFVAARGGHYQLRQFPFDASCNPVLAELARKDPNNKAGQRHPQACRMATIALAAGRAGGAESYRKVHAWLMHAQSAYTDDRLRAAAGELGIDLDAVLARTSDAEIAAEIAEDVQEGQQLGLQGIPLIFVNGKQVARWSHGDAPLLVSILEEAARSDGP